MSSQTCAPATDFVPEKNTPQRMAKNQFQENQNEWIETTGTVHTGIRVDGAQAFHGWPGGVRHGQDTELSEADAGELGAL